MDNTGYIHERNALMVTLRNIIVSILDRFGIEYNQKAKDFTKKGTTKTIATLDEIMKGL